MSENGVVRVVSSFLLKEAVEGVGRAENLSC